MAIASADVLIAQNPSTGEELGRVDSTPCELVGPLVARAREAQRLWSGTAWSERRKILKRWARALARDADAWAIAIGQEIGKPRGEALGEVVMSLDAIRWTIRQGGRALADETLGAGWQSILLIPGARVRYRPLGVVGMIGTWNYPLFLNAPAIAQAVAAGNGVVWKPSEMAPLVGRKLQESLDEAGFPSGLIAIVQGRGEVGRALVEARIDKGMFTGGIENGRRVLSTLAANGVSALAELSGFDPAIVLPDAPRASTVRSLTWGAFVGCGQTCVAVKRIYIIGDVRPWIKELAEAARAVRVGDPASAETDMGPLISEAARERFDRYVRATVERGAEVVTGAELRPGPGWFAAPTVLVARSAEPESALAGVFGPVVLVRQVSNVEEAVTAANASRFGLAASVWGRDLDAARAVAGRLDAGTVTINDAVTPIGHASAPFGGAKSSGFGRIHGVHGLREFVQTQVEQTRHASGLRPQLFPYSKRIPSLLKAYLRIFHRGS
ncbi:succinate-semialdehyde dehydrogenase / glutarate-semialdehyde dehydrogenase [Singulisphaera sp. GP187]|uniref:aldehyde dehydrogenase family protein n=1 Tax=Singulisphaera sp. GP187 TaxID=1882752 RepID=UPI00092A53F0|nr:aldehyde dehydrogenase family protein [Singulisphaera sp. GP187]SIO61908.1 succinate-semialdehyde dehydrogenase / glutarate-semialdehyde dehydrogenase [Singulisphaera sp. GP187]